MVEELGDLGLEVGTLSGVPGAACLVLSGKGGRQAVRSLEQAIQPLLDRGTTRLLLDCAAVEFFNSTALGYLIHLADRLRAIGGTLAFARVSKKVRMTFDLLGLQDFFRFFPDERSAAQYLAQSAPPAAPEETPAEEVPEEAQFEEIPDEPAKHAKPEVLAALPSWLDEVDDKPKKLPLGHPRWSMLGKVLFERIGAAALAELCRRKGLRSEGAIPEVVRRVQLTLGSPEQFLELFDEKTLGALLGSFRVPAHGPKRALIEAIVGYVERTTAESMSEALRAGKEVPPPSRPALPAELTGDSLREALENCPFPKLLRSEPAARDLLAKSLSKAFGPDQVAKGQTAGPGGMTPVDLEVAKKFGVLVRIARPLFAQKASAQKYVESLLGRLVLLGHAYPKGHLFALFVGEIPPEGKEMHEAVLRSIKEIGAHGVTSR